MTCSSLYVAEIYSSWVIKHEALQDEALRKQWNDPNNIYSLFP